MDSNVYFCSCQQDNSANMLGLCGLIQSKSFRSCLKQVSYVVFKLILCLGARDNDIEARFRFCNVLSFLKQTVHGVFQFKYSSIKNKGVTKNNLLCFYHIHSRLLNYPIHLCLWKCATWFLRIHGFPPKKEPAFGLWWHKCCEVNNSGILSREIYF